MIPEKLVKDNYGWMLTLAQSIVGEQSLAEDVVQEALVNALSKLDTFEHRSTIHTWLRRIVVNQSISVLRKTRRLSEDPLDGYQPEFDASGGCRIEDKWVYPVTPETLLSQKNTHQEILHAFSLIPESHSLIVKLRDVEGYSTHEVAKFLGISESNVKVRLHRARSALKKILEPTLKNEGSNHD